MVDDGIAVKLVLPAPDALLKALLRLVQLQVPGIGVRGEREQAHADGVQTLQELDLVFDDGHARTREQADLAFRLVFSEYLGEILAIRQLLVIFDGLVDIDLFAGRPLGKLFLAHFCKCIRIDFLLLNLDHESSSPFDSSLFRYLTFKPVGLNDFPRFRKLVLSQFGHVIQLIHHVNHPVFIGPVTVVRQDVNGGVPCDIHDGHCQRTEIFLRNHYILV